MKNIAIIVTYFGSWPDWFHVFLETCKYNSAIEWVFFTDCNVPDKSPGNTHFVKMTLEEFEKISSEKVGKNVNIERPYKVCDFRPAFGDIFSGYLKEYNFWGWGDIDVIYGDIEKIFTESNLEKYDVMSVRRRRTSGALTVLRNEKRMNKIYKKSPDFERVVKSSVGYAFDEAGKFRDRNIFSITDVLKEVGKKKGIKKLFWDYAKTDKKSENKNKKLYWKDGKMYDTEYGEEIYLYHFIERKNKPEFSVHKDIDMSNGFFIGREGIREANPSYSIQRRPLLLAGKRAMDSLRWMRDRIEQNWD